MRVVRLAASLAAQTASWWNTRYVFSATSARYLRQLQERLFSAPISASAPREMFFLPDIGVSSKRDSFPRQRKSTSNADGALSVAKKKLICGGQPNQEVPRLAS